MPEREQQVPRLFMKSISGSGDHDAAAGAGADTSASGLADGQANVMGGH